MMITKQVAPLAPFSSLMEQFLRAIISLFIIDNFCEIRNLIFNILAYKYF